MTAADATRARSPAVEEVLREAARLAAERGAAEAGEVDLIAVLRAWTPPREDRTATELHAALPDARRPRVAELEAAPIDATYRAAPAPVVGAGVMKLIDATAAEFGAANVGKRELAWALVARDARAAFDDPFAFCAAGPWIRLLCVGALGFALVRGAAAALMLFPERALELMPRRFSGAIPSVLIGLFLSLSADAALMARIERARARAWLKYSRRHRRQLHVSRATFVLAFVTFAVAMCKTCASMAT